MRKGIKKVCTQNQVLNLFLALLLSNFGSSNLSAPTADSDTNKITEAIDRISRFIGWIKRSILNLLKMLRAKFTNQISDQAPGEGPSNSWKEGLYPIRSLAVCAVQFVILSLLIFLETPRLFFYFPLKNPLFTFFYLHYFQLFNQFTSTSFVSCYEVLKIWYRLNHASNDQFHCSNVTVVKHR